MVYRLSADEGQNYKNKFIDEDMAMAVVLIMSTNWHSELSLLLLFTGCTGVHNIHNQSFFRQTVCFSPLGINKEGLMNIIAEAAYCKCMVIL